MALRRPGFALPELFALLALVAGGACWSCKHEAAIAPPPPDIVLITIDTLRADALGFTGNARVRTPNVDRLAGEGLVFTNAHAHNVMTLPSHVNILTGLYPYAHGVHDNEGFRLDPGIPTLATVLKGRGYATAAVIGAFPLDARFGLARGFDVYDEKYPRGANEYDFSEPERPASEVVAVARAWYRENAGHPRFLWVHLYDCHAPHVPPAALAQEYVDRPYLGEVAGVDQALGPFLDDLRGLGPRALVLLTSDHGEALGEHGEATHGLFAYEATLHIPMILWSPGLVRPGVTDALARHVDILPTLLEAGSAPAPAGLPGRSLLRGGDAATDTSYFEAFMANLTRGWAPLRGEMNGRWKYVELPVPELYDLTTDPREEHNLIVEKPDTARLLARGLPAREIPRPGKETAETLTRLRSLGYLGGSAPRKTDYGPPDDPKNLIDIDRDLQSTISLYQQGKMSEAIHLARTLIDRRPGMAQGYEYLSFLEGQSGHDERAIATLEAGRKRGLLDERLLSRLALLYNARGKSREALALLEPLRPSASTDTWNALGIVLATAGRVSDALAAFEAALRVDPKNAIAHQNIGLTLVQHGRPQEAVAAFEKAFSLNDRLPRAWNGLGVAQEQLGRHREALDSWQRAVRLDPAQFEALLNLGTVALQQGDRQLGRKALERFVATAPPGLFAQDIRRARTLLAAPGAGS
jgi:arylsulfatase A-like enzyme/tetratricopeptide (TPR) repeat protein